MARVTILGGRYGVDLGGGIETYRSAAARVLGKPSVVSDLEIVEARAERTSSPQRCMGGSRPWATRGEVDEVARRQGSRASSWLKSFNCSGPALILATPFLMDRPSSASSRSTNSAWVTAAWV